MTHNHTTTAKGSQQSDDKPDAEPHSESSTNTIYRVVATSFLRFVIHVEASSEEEALAIGAKVDGAHWFLEEDGDWHIDYAEPDSEATSDSVLALQFHNTL